MWIVYRSDRSLRIKVAIRGGEEKKGKKGREHNILFSSQPCAVKWQGRGHAHLTLMCRPTLDIKTMQLRLLSPAVSNAQLLYLLDREKHKPMAEMMQVHQSQAAVKQCSALGRNQIETALGRICFWCDWKAEKCDKNRWSEHGWSDFIRGRGHSRSQSAADLRECETSLRSPC